MISLIIGLEFYVELKKISLTERHQSLWQVVDRSSNAQLERKYSVTWTWTHSGRYGEIVSHCQSPRSQMYRNVLAKLHIWVCIHLNYFTPFGVGLLCLHVKCTPLSQNREYKITPVSSTNIPNMPGKTQVHYGKINKIYVRKRYGNCSPTAFLVIEKKDGLAAS